MTSRYYIAYFYRKARGLQNFSRSYSPPPPPIFSELFRYFELRIVSLAHAMVRHEFRSRYGLALSLSVHHSLSFGIDRVSSFALSVAPRYDSLGIQSRGGREDTSRERGLEFVREARILRVGAIKARTFLRGKDRRDSYTRYIRSRRSFIDRDLSSTIVRSEDWERCNLGAFNF